MAQKSLIFVVLKTPRILTFEFLGALKNHRILDDPEHARYFSGGFLTKWEKKAENYLAMLHLACGIITWRACLGG